MFLWKKSSFHGRCGVHLLVLQNAILYIGGKSSQCGRFIYQSLLGMWPRKLEGCEHVKSAEGQPLLLMFVFGTFLRSGKTAKTHRLEWRNFLKERSKAETLICNMSCLLGNVFEKVC